MATAAKTVSALIGQQLPDFIRADHPKFQRFLELYYAWLEDETKGNTVYHIMNTEKYRDVDETLDPFIRLFKQELLPYFPETSALSIAKILKGAREFYVKKGSEESVKWLFRVLFGIDVEIYYPKNQILIVSDGKWKLPQAFQLTLSPENDLIDVNLLEKHKATGSISKATCIIESANKTIDKTFGNEILEMYVSNVNKSFENGEDLEIPYVDKNGVEQLFSEKIIGSISGITIDSNIKTDPQQKRRGLLYNIGDPIVVFGGISNTPEAEDAVAIVGNVSVGSIEGLAITFPGYGYRTYSNTEVEVYRSLGDDPNANLSIDIRVAGVTTIDSNSNSQIKFLETVSVDKMPIEFLANTLISDANYAVFTQNNRNIVLTISNDSDHWYNNEYVYANSNGSFQTANFTAQILTANTGWAGGPSNLILYNVQNTAPLTTTGFLIGTNTLISTQSGSVFNVTAVVAESLNCNANSVITQALVYEDIATGGIALYNIINGGYGFRSTPSVITSSYFDTFWSENYAYGTAEQAAYRQPIGAFGHIAHIYINNNGSGYANGDAVLVTGRGYDFLGNVVVDGTGRIVSINILNRGEGYYGTVTDRVVSVTSGTGANASLTAYGFGEGVNYGVETGAIGRVRNVRILYRGFDYIDAPLISFKVVDMVINPILEAQNLVEGERVYQGATLETATFQGIVKNYNRSLALLRLFNYSGASGAFFNASLPFTSEGGVQFSINPLATVPAPSQYPVAVIATGLPNPYFYGNGQAKGYAEFYNGLIKFPGFYIATDGFLSSDKKLQDGMTYHNYSYVIESEKSLSSYENIVTDIVHPIGMIMLSRTVTRSEFISSIKTDNVLVSLSSGIEPGTTINIANSHQNVVTGIGGTNWANTGNVYAANVGDMLWIVDSTNTLRSQAKTIVAVESDTSMNVEGNFVYVGQGKMTTNSSNALVVISGNVNAVSDFIRTGDVIRINVGAITTANVLGISGNVLTLNTSVSNTVNNIVYLVVPDYSTSNYDYLIINTNGM